jgi:hypothetical protein
MSRTTKTAVASLVLGLGCIGVPHPASAISPVRLSGAISGLVTDSAGVPQMGAAVVLFNRQDRLFEKVFTDERGEFRFAGLFPDFYTIRVTLASFVPAVRANIQVLPGGRRMLNVNLNGLFSTIQLVYPSPDRGGIMSDDWKWVLRTASATRPVLRFLPGFDPADPGRTQRSLGRRRSAGVRGRHQRGPGHRLRARHFVVRKSHGSGGGEPRLRPGDRSPFGGVPNQLPGRAGCGQPGVVAHHAAALPARPCQQRHNRRLGQPSDAAHHVGKL